jgi:FkbM family methyltransferase
VPQINQTRWASWFLAALSRPILFRRLFATLSKAPILGAPLRRLVHRVFPQKTRVWFRISGGHGKGLWVNLDPRFEMDYASGNYERRVEQKLSEHLRPGTVFYDVGAHIGVLSLVAARLVGAQGAVFAFEADPANAARVEEHSRRNGLTQIHIVPCAAWSTEGRLRFERASTQSSLNQGTVATERAEPTANTIEVDAIALDDFSCRHAPPDLIKIDVEGAEAAVLRGCEQIFATKRPLLICEVHHEDALGDVSRWLLKQNYSFEWLVDSPNFPRHMLAKWHK